MAKRNKKPEFTEVKGDDLDVIEIVESILRRKPFHQMQMLEDIRQRLAANLETIIDETEKDLKSMKDTLENINEKWYG